MLSSISRQIFGNYIVEGKLQTFLATYLKYFHRMYVKGYATRAQINIWIVQGWEIEQSPNLIEHLANLHYTGINEVHKSFYRYKA